MAGGNPNNPTGGQGNPQQGGYPQPDNGSQQGGGPQQPGGYPQQGGPQGYPPQGYQPYGNAGQQRVVGGYMYPANMPTEYFGGFWIRVVSYVIDYVILAIPFCIIGFALGLSGSAAQQAGSPADPSLGMQGGLNLGSLLIGWLYFAFLESKYGGTLGKLALGLRVVEDGGMFPSFARASGRYFAKILSGCLLLIGFIMVAFHPQKRGLHDLIAATYVVRKECVNPQQTTQQY